MTSRRDLLTLALLTTGAPASALAAPSEEVEVCDVVVVGGGIGGLSAALSAAESGASVVLLEKNAFLGGDTILSGGTFNAVDPKLQKPLGIRDDYDRFARQILESAEGRADPDVVKVYARECTTSLLWLEAHGMRFLPELFEIFGSGFRRTHRPAFPRGRGYVRCLSEAALDYGVKIRLESEARSFVRLGGRIAGVVVRERGAGKRYMARGGVVIASGGFAANTALLKRYAPAYAGLPIDGQPSSTGEMLLRAREIGADLCNLEFVECVPGAPPGIDYQVRLDYNADDMILVNASGRRFTRETGTRREIAEAIAAEKGPCFEISEGARVEKFNAVNQKDLWRGYFAKVAWKADTPEDLALKLGLPPAALREEVDLALASGKFSGPPYWGVKVHLRIHCTLGGLRIDPSARVLDERRRPIPGLWAAGSVTGNIHGVNRLGANGINCACSFGRIAGSEATKASRAFPGRERAKHFS